MVEDFRKPKIISDNGLVSIQNGTYEQVSNDEVLENIRPFEQYLNPQHDFYELLDKGSQDDVMTLLYELKTFISQLRKMLAKIKKANGKFIAPDIKYFVKKFEDINNTLADIPYGKAKILEKQYAKEFAKEFRECIKISIAHNYNETLFLQSKGVDIEIPEEFITNMIEITQNIESKTKISASIQLRINFGQNFENTQNLPQQDNKITISQNKSTADKEKTENKKVSFLNRIFNHKK